MEKRDLTAVFESFKNEVFADLPNEEAKKAALESFIFAFSKI